MVRNGFTGPNPKLPTRSQPTNAESLSIEPNTKPLKPLKISYEPPKNHPLALKPINPTTTFWHRFAVVVTLFLWRNRFAIIFMLLICTVFAVASLSILIMYGLIILMFFSGSAYFTFVSTASEFPIKEYIVVGGGTASCPLATTRFRVLVLERGDIEFYNNSLIGFGDRRLINASYEWVEVFKPAVREWQRSFLAGIGVYHCFELNGTKIAGSVFDTEGVRHNEADLLSYVYRKRIEVVLFASVERVLLARSVEGSVSAIGFVFRNVEGGYRHAMLKDGGEVLLAAGAIGTPQLLLLSGVGPQGYLASLGIPVGHHSPYVGQFMYENTRNVPVRFDPLLMQVVRITELGTYIRAGSYIVQFASPARPVFLRSPTVATLMEKVICPVSFKNLRLASTEVRAYTVFQFNYFSDAGDHERCINRTSIKGCVLNSRAMYKRDFRFVALLPNQWGDGLMGEFCGRSVTTIWHYHGGCLADRVVNRDWKFIEVNASRIVDGTAFIVSPGTNPQATVLMMGSIWHEAAERRDEADELNVIC